VCEVCGNDYDKPIEIVRDGETHVFDSFECAIHALAPTCSHCGCRIIGHGVEADGRIFCCAHCAEEEGITALTDRADAASAQ
jgi:Rieske Fe-S protein